MQNEIACTAGDAERQGRIYETLVSATPDLIYAFDLDHCFTFANRALLEMWGLTAEESIGRQMIEVGYEPWHADMHEREIDQVIATKRGVRGEVGFRHAALGWRVYDYIFMPVFDAFGEVELIAGSTRDITDIKRAEEHLQLLVHELNHRVKNTLATVQSLAAQTFKGNAAEPGARASFDARLIALSNAHTVLTQANWDGADLRDIAAKAMAPFGEMGKPDRIEIAGADFRLRPQTALALAMAFHELASNAVKYGGLSTEGGRVGLRWVVDADLLRITWQEIGGPTVNPPQRKGFGSRLLERGLANELNGRVQLDYRPSGVVCTIEAPLRDEA